MIDKKRIYENMLRLVAVPSISGTDDEHLAADKIEELLYEIPYFATHKDNVRQVSVPGDPLGRTIVTAYLETAPGSRKAVILTGHYDVVDVDEFGQYQKEAFDPETITPLMGSFPMDEDTRSDWESGEWLFGRGTADMKIGHALSLELLRHFSEEGGINGNILYVAVCGEETNSEGMLGAIPFFNQFAEEKGLDYEALLLTECFEVEDMAHDKKKYVHIGGHGKVMPLFFTVGEVCHGEFPFLGLDPNMINAEIYLRMQLNTDFSQEVMGDVTQPPVCLKSQDLKTTYSISTPLYAASYYSITTVKLDPEEMIAKLSKIAEDSFASAIELVSKRADEFESKFGTRPQTHSYTPCVKLYSEIYEEAAKGYDGDFDEYIGEYVKELQEEKLEMQQIAIRLVRKVYELSGSTQPMVIVAFVPPFYPDCYPKYDDPRVKKLMTELDQVFVAAEEKTGEEFAVKDFYGISDLSYTDLDPDMDFDGLFGNVVGIGSMYSMPVEEMKKFHIPSSIVLGCYGKDFHKTSERLNLKYNFDVLPYMYIQLIEGLLS